MAPATDLAPLVWVSTVLQVRLSDRLRESPMHRPASAQPVVCSPSWPQRRYSRRHGVCELVKRRTRAGDPYFVGHLPKPDGGWTRVLLFFDEMRTGADGTPTEVWQMRCEEVLSPPSRHERAPPPSRRVGAAQDGGRPRASGNGA